MSQTDCSDSSITDPEPEVLVGEKPPPVFPIANLEAGHSNMGAVAPAAPLLQGSFVRFFEHYFCPGALAFHVESLCGIVPYRQWGNSKSRLPGCAIQKCYQ